MKFEIKKLIELFKTKNQYVLETLTTDQGVTERVISLDVPEADPEEVKFVKENLAAALTDMLSTPLSAKDFKVSEFKVLKYEISSTSSIELMKLSKPASADKTVGGCLAAMFICPQYGKERINIFCQEDGLKEILDMTGLKDEILTSFLLSEFLTAEDVKSIKGEK